MIRLEDISKSFGTRTLFDGVTYSVTPGERTALVGANGAGKTTLLSIICGLTEPDGGKVITPAKADLGYLPQKPNQSPMGTVLAEAEAGAQRISELKAAMDRALAALEKSGEDAKAARLYEEAEANFRTAGGYALTAKATSVLSGLGFRQGDLERDPRELSGGWRMRLELARLILRDPDIMVLDEPTNHLDLPSLAWFEAFLQRFRGTLLFVSHDRPLLNKLSTVTLHLHGGKVTPYAGNFDFFLEEREIRLAQAEARREDLRRRREHMEKFVQRFGAKASKATQAQSRVKMIARIRDLEEEVPKDDGELSLGITLPPPPKLPRVVLTVEEGSIGYDAPLTTGMRLSVEKGARVAIIGANGIGKSTFLKTISGHVEPLGGSFDLARGVTLTYFAQDQRDTFDMDASVLENLQRATDLPDKAARSLLGGFLFSGDDVFKPARVLSGGELSRLGLASALGRSAGLILLDEPTNHLDMGAALALAEGLAGSEATMLFVSHDRSFIDAVCTHVFAMLPDGRSMLFQGQLADYARMAPLAGFPNVLDPESSAAGDPDGDGGSSSKGGQKGNGDDAKELKRERQRLTTRISRLEEDMGRQKSEIERLEKALATQAPDDYESLGRLGDELESAKSTLDEAESAWLEAETAREDIESRLRDMGRL